MKYLSTIGLLLLPGLAIGDSTGPKTHKPRLSGGATTVFDTSRNAFSLPARNMSIMRRDSFFIGNAFFQQPWVVAPASTTARDGLGPIFNANSCQGCHVKDGRGKPPISKDDTFLSTLVRLSIPATTDAEKLKALQVGVIPEPVYGDQLQPNGIPGIKGEATPRLDFAEISGQFDDGTTYTLLKPALSLDALNYGAMHKDVMTSVRVAPAMIGLGLLETIPEQAILAQADPDDKNNDGISGRPNQVWDIHQKKPVMGRFGWKANQPNIAQQSAGAFHGDMGLSTPLIPKQPCSKIQSHCLKAPHGGQPEVSAEIFEKVIFYASTLGVPARRNTDDPIILSGEKLFNRAGCNQCHISTFTTGTHDNFPELSDQTIHPYTDLLLHDMGEGLADGRPDFLASNSEWRTPPLWGIGLVKTVNGHTRFLHDGRARNLLEAVLWHGGEAETAKQKVVAMSENDRAALIAFLNSL